MLSPVSSFDFLSFRSPLAQSVFSFLYSFSLIFSVLYFCSFVGLIRLVDLLETFPALPGASSSSCCPSLFPLLTLLLYLRTIILIAALHHPTSSMCVILHRGRSFLCYFSLYLCLLLLLLLFLVWKLSLFI